MGLMTMRRLSLIFVLAAVLSGCSSGSSNEASTTRSTSTTASTSPSESQSPDGTSTSPEDSAGGGASDFCAAFKELDDSKGAGTAAAFGAQARAAAADMRRYAPPEIKDAVETYADVIENLGKTAQSGSIDDSDLEKALATALAGKPADIGRVAIWVGQNCHL
jgi:ABC-type glycerol-3-phosphate transport system substrate-binding protein